MKFVIQEHRAGERVRYYLRLERDGLLKGWALPKGLPKEWGRQRLALQVGDGDLSLIGFQDKVQKGRYGPGEIRAWDTGDYECHKWEEGKIVFTLNGSRIKGSYALVGFPKGGEKSWLLGQTKARSGVESAREGNQKTDFKSSSPAPAPRSIPVKSDKVYGLPLLRWKRKVQYPSMRKMSILQWGKKDFRLLLWVALFAALIYGVIRLFRWLF